MVNKYRRYLLAATGIFGVSALSRTANSMHTETHFEEESLHKLVYQCNKVEPDYIESVLFSCGEMLRKYGDDIELVVSVMGPGLHLITKQPGRYIKDIHQQRVQSLQNYGVVFNACGNTMKSLKLTQNDLLNDVRVVPIGVDDLMILQENGFKYVSW